MPCSLGARSGTSDTASHTANSHVQPPACNRRIWGCVWSASSGGESPSSCSHSTPNGSWLISAKASRTGLYVSSAATWVCIQYMHVVCTSERQVYCAVHAHFLMSPAVAGLHDIRHPGVLSERPTHCCVICARQQRANPALERDHCLSRLCSTIQPGAHIVFYCPSRSLTNRLATRAPSAYACMAGTGG